MRLIDGDALAKILNDLWLLTSPSERDDKETALERAAMCRGIDDCVKYVHDSPTIGGWISVKERLPESAGQMVLVTAHNSFYNTDEVFPAFLAYGPTVWCTYDTIRMQKVTPTDNRVSDRLTITHWMPMPKPPKEEKRND